MDLTNNPDGGGEVGRPAWSPDGSRIAFVSHRDGNSEIHLMDADGSNPVNISNHPDLDMQPSWSPDGSQIVFVSNRDDDAWELYVMDSDGTNQVRITQNPGFLDLGPMWSPDGNRIAFWTVRGDADSGNIYVMNTDGSGVTQVTDTRNWDFDPDWSPDGIQLVYLGNSGRGWFIVDADGSSDPVQINIGGGWPDWSPDGAQIAYTCSDGWVDLCVSNVDGSGEVNLTEAFPGVSRWGDWLPTVK